LFAIDIALPEFKIGFEINGNQHYEKNGDLKKYYADRNKYISDNGWTLHQIHYSLCFDEVFIISLYKKAISNLDLFDFDYENYLKSKLNTYTPKKQFKTKTCDCGNKIYSQSKMCKKCFDIKQRKVERPKLETLRIEIKKFGFLAVGRKYGVSDNAIRKWIKNLEN
jgi:hypothetical protein